MTDAIKPPSISETGFNCPHCGVLATQYWFRLFADALSGDRRTPLIPDDDILKRIDSSDLGADAKASIRQWAQGMMTRLIFTDQKETSTYLRNEVHNLYLSRCFNCQKYSVWVHHALVFPAGKLGVRPNVNLPDDIARVFEEARDILNVSPRGAAALLRLCVQKVCIFLGEKGNSLDEDIASLVKKGLHPLVQKSLDVVRVIGNEAVHPGTIDLKDDRDTATQLLQLINAIADQLITHPRTVRMMYDALPAEKRKAIEVRNEKALDK